MQMETAPTRIATRELVAQYTDPNVLPNRLNRLVLRKHSRLHVREWLRQLPGLGDGEIRETFWATVLGDAHVNIPDRPELDRELRSLTSPEPISPAGLDAYLTAHPDALSGNAEADICPKHRAFAEDVPRLRETMSALMDPDVDVTTRLDEVLKGRYHLKGFGKATATVILQCWNDGQEETGGPKYSIWSGHTERALDLLNLPYRIAGAGMTYQNIWEQQRHLLLEFPQLQDLSDADLFMYFVDPRGLDMARSASFG